MYESMHKQPDELVVVAHRTDQMETSRSSNLEANEKNIWTYWNAYNVWAEMKASYGDMAELAGMLISMDCRAIELAGARCSSLMMRRFAHQSLLETKPRIASGTLTGGWERNAEAASEILSAATRNVRVVLDSTLSPPGRVDIWSIWRV